MQQNPGVIEANISMCFYNVLYTQLNSVLGINRHGAEVATVSIPSRNISWYKTKTSLSKLNHSEMIHQVSSVYKYILINREKVSRS